MSRIKLPGSQIIAYRGDDPKGLKRAYDATGRADIVTRSSLGWNYIVKPSYTDMYKNQLEVIKRERINAVNRKGSHAQMFQYLKW